MLKICSVLPDIYIMIAFMGMDFAGARASSQAFLRKSSSVSMGVGAGVGLLPGFCKWGELAVVVEWGGGEGEKYGLVGGVAEAGGVGGGAGGFGAGGEVVKVDDPLRAGERCETGGA